MHIHVPLHHRRYRRSFGAPAILSNEKKKRVRLRFFFRYVFFFVENQYFNFNFLAKIDRGPYKAQLDPSRWELSNGPLWEKFYLAVQKLSRDYGFRDFAATFCFLASAISSPSISAITFKRFELAGRYRYVRACLIETHLSGKFQPDRSSLKKFRKFFEKKTCWKKT